MVLLRFAVEFHQFTFVNVVLSTLASVICNKTHQFPSISEELYVVWGHPCRRYHHHTF